ncbi:DUF4402 domain-containing protein [Croceibacterium aestuarii]|uniref:DUF4402 domain-containing protein n=1 Tax=Croceibacterium aestuarii TaxID=3064139 RepID=UPI00272DEE8E|nr:DUF4402 domain-containing protein [Croceibacterium sp. D39]
MAPGQARAQDTASADALTVIQTPGSIAKTADMAFGSIVQPNAAGTIVLTPASTANCTASSGLVRSGVCRAARFNIYGKRNWKVRIRETNGGTVTLAAGAGNSMTMDAITLGTTGMTSANGGGSGWNLGRYNIDTANGITEFRLGGTLHVGAAQPAGVYHGTVLVQIQFN